MIRQLLNRIKEYQKSTALHQEGVISNADFEQVLLSEIEYLQENFEEELSAEIIKQEEDIIRILKALKKTADSKKIDKNSLTNLILTEFNQWIIQNNIL